MKIMPLQKINLISIRVLFLINFMNRIRNQDLNILIILMISIEIQHMGIIQVGQIIIDITLKKIIKMI